MIDTVDLMNAAMASGNITDLIDDFEGVTVTLSGRLPKPGLRLNVMCDDMSTYQVMRDRLFDPAQLVIDYDRHQCTGFLHGTRVLLELFPENWPKQVWE
jgi:hypothetical protein